MPTVSTDVTQLLATLSALSPHEDEVRLDVLNRLLPLVYDELRGVAHNLRRDERTDLTLSTTALVHEAYLKLAGHAPQAETRTHFFALASRVMRQVLVDYARTRNRLKRGGGVRPLRLDDTAVGDIALPTRPLSDEAGLEILALDDALTQLEARDPRQSQIVECRYFGGLSIGQTAAALDLSPATVKREWHKAKLWLYRTLRPTA